VETIGLEPTTPGLQSPLKRHRANAAKSLKCSGSVLNSGHSQAFATTRSETQNYAVKSGTWLQKW
jgi:hypothetical protein